MALGSAFLDPLMAHVSLDRHAAAHRDGVWSGWRRRIRGGEALSVVMLGPTGVGGADMPAVHGAEGRARRSHPMRHPTGDAFFRDPRLSSPPCS